MFSVRFFGAQIEAKRDTIQPNIFKQTQVTEKQGFIGKRQAQDAA